MAEDMHSIGALRKCKSSEIDGYFRGCAHFVAAGRIPVCQANCRVCEGCRRFVEVLKFYAKRDRTDRPERKCI